MSDSYAAAVAGSERSTACAVDQLALLVLQPLDRVRDVVVDDLLQRLRAALGVRVGEVGVQVTLELARDDARRVRARRADRDDGRVAPSAWIALTTVGYGAVVVLITATRLPLRAPSARGRRGSPARRRARGRGVGGIGAGDRLQRRGRVVDRPRDRARRVLRLGDRQHAVAADEPDRRLEADDAGDAGRRDQLRRVGRRLQADGQRRQARGRRRRRAAGRAGRRLVGVGRQRAPGRRATSSPRACSRRTGRSSSVTFVLPRMIAPAAFELGDERRVVLRHRVLQGDRAARGRQPLDVDRRRRAAPGCRAAGRAGPSCLRSLSSAVASSIAFAVDRRGRPGSPGPRRCVSAMRARYALVSVSAVSVPAVMRACRLLTDSVSSENGSVRRACRRPCPSASS